jgi:hypothetical protein
MVPAAQTFKGKKTILQIKYSNADKVQERKEFFF